MQKRTELVDYTLRFDGIIEVQAAKLPELLALGISPRQLRVLEVVPDVVQFNQLSDDPILVADQTEEPILNFEWQLPPEYLMIDLSSYFAALTPPDNDAAEARVQNELQEVKKRGLENLFRTIIYVIATLRENQVVWGVGRGSSCASYLLYLAGLHLVNPLKYQIPHTEFFH